MKLVNINHMLKKAYQEKYAVAHININNLEWTKSALEVADELKAPIIISASVGAVKYFGGYHVVSELVKSLIVDLNIKTEVALHLDHGNYDDCIKALEAGFSSIMYDGSHEIFSENYKNTKQLILLAHSQNASIEAEIGTIGGEEDGIISSGQLVSNIDEAIQMQQLGIDALAVGINNIHGKYPSYWKSLNFDILNQINEACRIPLVLHGGSGIPKDQVQTAISLGIAKININTELQIANAEAIKEFVISKKIDKNKNYDPRKIANFGMQALKKVLKEKFAEFGSIGKANI
ncbi:fructose-bisphosphate aldolase [[Mycoplasma] phocae]|uniref:Fructose-bisphosphate aldolase n=1 Tax=[Mycoplasma] phocae TaxID=142651 RepID=A0A2Z5IQW2_9BACT|nr:ketose-bisphosphate aldolase [[Mycoplasma] phocae]AXE60721.1 fructose-bisphosphate aldolase [[Mycoplasma] phocae]